MRADRVAALQVERPRGEPVGGGGEGSHGTDLDRVAGEGAAEVLAGCDGDLLGGAAVEQLDESIPRDLVAEARAPGAQHAPFPIEIDQRRQRERLPVRALRLHVPALARSVGERLILQRAFAAAVTHRTVEWMVDQQELEDPNLRLVDLLVGELREDLHPVGNRRGARRHQLALALHLHVALAARRHRLEQRVVAEPRDLDPQLLSGSDDERALRHGHLLAVDGERDQLSAHLFSSSVPTLRVVPDEPGGYATASLRLLLLLPLDPLTPAPRRARAPAPRGAPAPSFRSCRRSAPWPPPAPAAPPYRTDSRGGGRAPRIPRGNT